MDWICLVLLFVVIVVALVMWSLLGLFISVQIRFIAGSINKYCSEESDCENCLNCFPKLEHTSPLRFLYMSVKEELSTLNDWCSCGEIDFNFSNVSGENFFFVFISTSFNETLAFIRGMVAFYCLSVFSVLLYFCLYFYFYLGLIF